MFSSHDKHERLGPASICCSREVCLQTPVGISWTCPNFFQDLVLLSVCYLSKTKKKKKEQTLYLKWSGAGYARVLWE